MAEVVNNGPTRPGIKDSWSLIAFKKAHGQMRVGKAVNKETGDVFDSTVFVDEEGAKTYVSFSSNLGTLNAKQIAERAKELQVVLLNTGTYKLCKQGEDPTEDWDVVDF